LNRGVHDGQNLSEMTFVTGIGLEKRFVTRILRQPHFTQT
jgi:hypothetical protein